MKTKLILATVSSALTIPTAAHAIETAAHATEIAVLGHESCTVAVLNQSVKRDKGVRTGWSMPTILGVERCGDWPVSEGSAYLLGAWNGLSSGRPAYEDVRLVGMNPEVGAGGAFYTMEDAQAHLEMWSGGAKHAGWPNSIDYSEERVYGDLRLVAMSPGTGTGGIFCTLKDAQTHSEVWSGGARHAGWPNSIDYGEERVYEDLRLVAMSPEVGAGGAFYAMEDAQTHSEMWSGGAKHAGWPNSIDYGEERVYEDLQLVAMSPGTGTGGIFCTMEDAQTHSEMWSGGAKHAGWPNSIDYGEERVYEDLRLVAMSPEVGAGGAFYAMEDAQTHSEMWSGGARQAGWPNSIDYGEERVYEDLRLVAMTVER